MTLVGLIAIVLLIAANAFFVASEFAFVALRRVRLEEQAADGDARAIRALEVNTQLSFVLSGAQLGITATSLVLGFIASPVLGQLFEPALAWMGVPANVRTPIATGVAFTLATTLQMILGELAPKNLAIAKPEATARMLAGATHVYTRSASWLIRIFDNSANGLLRLFGITPVEHLEQGVSSEDLELIIVESSSGGHLSTNQADLLTRVLEFRQLRAGDVMVARTQVVAIAADATGADLRRLADRSGHSRFPVVDADLDEVLGVVQAKDLLRHAPAERDTLPVRVLMSAALAVPESSPLSAVVAEMRRGRSPLAVVIDEYGSTTGVATLEDIVEELVGSIQDEHDPAERGAQRLSEDRWRVPGTWRINEAVRDTGLPLPEGDYDTVAGLIIALLARMPEQGDVVTVNGLELTVEQMDELAVAWVLLQQTDNPGSDTDDATGDSS